jgi:5-methylcytosine-specific restriction endonuclease McrA
VNQDIINDEIPPKPSCSGLKPGTVEFKQTMAAQMRWKRMYVPEFKEKENKRIREGKMLKARAQGVKPRFEHKALNAPSKPSTKGLKKGTQEYNDAIAARVRWKRLYVPGWKEQVNKRDVEYARNKRNNDTDYRLHCFIRCTMGRAIKYTEEFKLKRSLDYIGCSIEKLKNHLASQFNGQYTWDTFGKEWAIDHIIPLASRLPVELTAHYTNLQPLSIKENNAKDSKIVKEYLYKIIAHPDTPGELCDVALSLLSY